MKRTIAYGLCLIGVVVAALNKFAVYIDIRSSKNMPTGLPLLLSDLYDNIISGSIILNIIVAIIIIIMSKTLGFTTYIYLVNIFIVVAWIALIYIAAA